MEEAGQRPDSEQAEGLFCELLRQPLLLQEQVAPSVSKLMYLTYKNLGSVLHAQHRNQEAVEKYLKALKIDRSDYMLWHNMGSLAVELGDFLFAKKAFERYTGLSLF